MTKTLIVNLTQHAASADQTAAGVVDLCPRDRLKLSSLLTFDTLPTPEEIERRAEEIVFLGVGAMDDHYELLVFEPSVPLDASVNWVGCAMIGGAPYLMSALERACRVYGITPVYAFSVRESVEETLPDGSVRKTNVFRHAGFVEVAA